MKSYVALAEALTNLATKFGGWDDQRYVWDNVDLLLKKKVIDHSLYGAIRSSQQARNSIRRLGRSAVNRDEARRFAEVAYTTEQALREKLAA